MNRIIPLILAVALFMEMMDSTVIATSLPAIAADIGTEPIALKLAMTAYLVALAIFIPISGWMADRFGAKNVFRWAIFVFMLGSIACAFSNSLGTFVCARFFQGMGGAMMTPLARLVMVRTVPKHLLVSSMAWLTVPALVGPMAGPPIGGFLTTFFSWHWIFFINIPIGIAGIILVTIYLPHIKAPPVNRLDWRGFFLAGLSFSGILLGMSVISLPALPPMVGICATLTGLLAGGLYLLHARKTDKPLLNPNLFRHKLFALSIVGGSVFRMGLGALPFIMPLMLQLSFGLSPFDTGLIMLFGAVGALTAKVLITKLYASFGFRHVLIATALFAAFTLLLNGFFTITTPTWIISFVLFIGGISRSVMFTGLTALSFADIDDDESGPATAISSVAQQLSLACGVALGGGMLELLGMLHGGENTGSDFQITFFMVGTIALLACIPFFRLPPNAGSAMTGHRPRAEITAP